MRGQPGRRVVALVLVRCKLPARHFTTCKKARAPRSAFRGRVRQLLLPQPLARNLRRQSLRLRVDKVDAVVGAAVAHAMERAPQRAVLRKQRQRLARISRRVVQLVVGRVRRGGLKLALVAIQRQLLRRQDAANEAGAPADELGVGGGDGVAGGVARRRAHGRRGGRLGQRVLGARVVQAQLVGHDGLRRGGQRAVEHGQVAPLAALGAVVAQRGGGVQDGLGGDELLGRALGGGGRGRVGAREPRVAQALLHGEALARVLAQHAGDEALGVLGDVGPLLGREVLHDKVDAARAHKHVDGAHNVGVRHGQDDLHLARQEVRLVLAAQPRHHLDGDGLVGHLVVRQAHLAVHALAQQAADGVVLVDARAGGGGAAQRDDPHVEGALRGRDERQRAPRQREAHLARQRAALHQRVGHGHMPAGRAALAAVRREHGAVEREVARAARAERAALLGEPALDAHGVDGGVAQRRGGARVVREQHARVGVAGAGAGGDAMGGGGGGGDGGDGGDVGDVGDGGMGGMGVMMGMMGMMGDGRWGPGGGRRRAAAPGKGAGQRAAGAF
ncbi:Serine/threonine-protein kinase [Gracilaria domingensis]|nr:Serine/threonine-protein kinase [Gracilaria domingensis]